eukprot:Colp12_sorted_trinity150504_noHs@22768
MAAALVIFLFVVAFTVIPLLVKKYSKQWSLRIAYFQEPEFAKDLAKAESEVFTIQSELKTISMQDEFARYARLERKLHKEKEVLQRLSAKLSGKENSIAKNILFGTRAIMGVLHIILFVMYRTEPIFFLPSEWLSPLGSFIAAPTGVEGAVGILFWMFVCRQVVYHALPGLNAN